jgi:hypothetical protein
MAASFDASLSTDLDWVRFLSGDRDITNPQLDDEEIHALLIEEPNKYCAAAAACEMILAKSGGLIDKQVGDLRLKWSDEPRNAYGAHIQYLRERCAYEMDRTNYIFKVL